jgi:hypothetical protein
LKTESPRNGAKQRGFSESSRPLLQSPRPVDDRSAASVSSGTSGNRTRRILVQRTGSLYLASSSSSGNRIRRIKRMHRTPFKMAQGIGVDSGGTAATRFPCSFRKRDGEPKDFVKIRRPDSDSIPWSCDHGSFWRTIALGFPAIAACVYALSSWMVRSSRMVSRRVRAGSLSSTLSPTPFPISARPIGDDMVTCPSSKFSESPKTRW